WSAHRGANGGGAGSSAQETTKPAPRGRSPHRSAPWRPLPCASQPRGWRVGRRFPAPRLAASRTLHRHLRLEWEIEGGTLAGAALRPDPPVVPAHDAYRDVEPEPRAAARIRLSPRPLCRAEQQLGGVAVETDAVVAYEVDRNPVLELVADLDAAAF